MWKDIKNWAAPLGVWIFGELLFLIFLVVSSVFNTQVAITAAQTSNVTSTFWGWGWLMTPGIARSIAITGYQLMLLVFVYIAFMKSKY
jgi:hypothetical protein